MIIYLFIYKKEILGICFFICMLLHLLYLYVPLYMERHILIKMIYPNTKVFLKFPTTWGSYNFIMAQMHLSWDLTIGLQAPGWAWKKKNK